MHTHVATSMQDPNGSLLSSQAVPERLRGLVPHTAGDQNELQNVPRFIQVTRYTFIAWHPKPAVFVSETQ